VRPSQYGPCGLYCGACVATDCDGCLVEEPSSWVARCEIRKCAAQNGVDFCYQCYDYPCQPLWELMHARWPHHQTMETNLQCIKDRGVGEWLLQQQREWRCPGCGAPRNWYQKRCECGERLEAMELPEE